MPRGTLAGQLAAMGFADTARARALIAGLGLAVGGDGTVLQDTGAARTARDAAGVPDGHPGAARAAAAPMAAMPAAARI